MTPWDLGNIYTTRNSCRNTLPHVTWHSNYHIFICWEGSLLVATSKFSLLTIKQHSATRKYLFRSPQNDRSGLERISTNTNHSYHQHSSPEVNLNWSNYKVRFSLNQAIRKRWGARLVNVIKHLHHKVFLLTPSLEGWPTKVKEAPSPHEGIIKNV